MIQILSIVIIFFAISGCSLTTLHKPHLDIKDVLVDSNISFTSPKYRQLVQRFKEYWHYRMTGDYKKAFRYELPYQQYTISLQRYKLLSGGGYLADKIFLKEIINKDGCARVSRIVVLNDHNISKKGKWCYIKDNWYHKFYQSILPPKSIEEAEFQ